MKTLSLIFLTCFSLTLCSWGYRNNKSENVVKEQREIGHFTEIKTSSAIHVYLTQGKAESLQVEAEENIIPYIETKVVKNCLIISLNGNRKHKNLSTNKPMNVYVSVPNLEKIEASSASHIYGTNEWKATDLEIEISSAAQLDMNLEVNRLDLEVTSAAKAQLAGKGNLLDAEVNSAAYLDAEKFIVSKADIEVSSAGKATIYVADELEYEISSMGKLDYYGNPHILKAESNSGARHRSKD